MTPQKLLETLKNKGVTVTTDGHLLHVDAPVEAVGVEEYLWLKRHKQALIALLQASVPVAADNNDRGAVVAPGGSRDGKRRVSRQRLLRRLNKAIFPEQRDAEIAELKNLSNRAGVPIRIIHVDLSADTETVTHYEPQ